MPVLPTLAQNLYFYGAAAAFLTFGVSLAIGLLSTATLPGPKPAAAPATDSLAHAH